MRTVLKQITKWEGAKLAFFLFVVLGTVLIFSITPSLLPSALLSILLFFIFSPIIDNLERKGLSRSHGITAVFLVCGLILTLAATWLTPRISQEYEAFQKGSDKYSANIGEKLKAQEISLLGAYPVFKNSQLTEKAILWFDKSIDRVLSASPNLASQLFICLFLVPFLTFILLKDIYEIKRALLKLVPNRYFETVYSIIHRIFNNMGGFVSARIIEAVIVFAMVTIGCWILGIPYAIFLGVFAGATNAIPYLGPLIGAVPGAFFALVEPTIPNQLVCVTLVYLFANLIDMLVVFPLVVAKIVDLHPVVVVVSVIIGSQVFGIIGMILAVPITSIIKILIQELFHRMYGDQDYIR